MTTTNYISEPDIHLVDNEKIREYAHRDANVDNETPLDFTAFNTRLRILATAVNRIVVAGTVANFMEWAESSQQTFEQMAPSCPQNNDALALQVNRLDTKTRTNLNNAKDRYADKIIQLHKDKIAWQKRFGPRLFAEFGEPMKKNPHLLVGLIVILLAVESMANSQFFAQASVLGLLGGTLTAITVSMGNVCIPLMLAFFGCRLFFRHDNYRYLGIAVIVLFFLWALGFNYIVAQYREGTLSANDSSVLNFVLLFALGAAVAGISFWKMWSYLDPYKQARKSLDDLENAQLDFHKTVCADLVTEQEKYNGINAEINEQDAVIPTRFQATDANYNRVHSEAVVRANAVFTEYHRQYAPPHIDPDPDCPEVTLESAEAYGVGITVAERQFVSAMREILDSQLSTANQEWIPMLLTVLERIADLITRFNEEVQNVLSAWNLSAQAG